MFSSRMSVVVESRLESVPLAGRLVRAFCLESGISGLDCGQIELCVVEAANNCVAHAYRNEPGHKVEVSVMVSDHELRFEICDWGQPMDPDVLRAPRDQLLYLEPTAVDSAPERGRGLAIMEAIMDTLGYSTCNGKNKLFMTKRVTSAAEKA